MRRGRDLLGTALCRTWRRRAAAATAAEAARVHWNDSNDDDDDERSDCALKMLNACMRRLTPGKHDSAVFAAAAAAAAGDGAGRPASSWAGGGTCGGGGVPAPTPFPVARNVPAAGSARVRGHKIDSIPQQQQRRRRRQIRGTAVLPVQSAAKLSVGAGRYSAASSSAHNPSHRGVELTTESPN